jgi:hypothetical protein
VRKVFIIAGVLLLLLAGAAWWTVSSIDVLVKGALEYYGPRLLGVSVQVGTVEISTQSGRGNLRNIVVGNPSGYSSTQAVRIGEAALALDASTITSDVVVIREITVDAPDITYELVGGKANLEVIQRNIEAALRREGGSGSAAAQDSKERRYVIHAANIRKAQVRVTNPLLRGGGLSFTLPDIALRNIGGDGKGVTGAEAARIVTAALVARIAARALTSGQLFDRGAAGAKDLLKELFRPQ